jgi:hypothetical protein
VAVHAVIADENAMPVSPPNSTARGNPGERVLSKNSNATATPDPAISALVACHSPTPVAISPGESGVAAAAW